MWPTRTSRMALVDTFGSKEASLRAVRSRSMNDRDADDLTRDPQEERRPESPFLDPVVKSNDPKALKKQAIDAKSKALRQENDVRELLGTQAGIRFMARLLGEICYIDESCFNPNSSTMSNIAGRRQIGQTVKTLIRDVDFELWVKVDRELEAARPKPKTSEKDRSRT